MNCADLIYEASSLGNKATTIELDWKKWLNRAQRRIAQRRNWSGCHDQRQVTIPQGTLSAKLDINFKEVSSEKSPISYNDPSQTYQFPIPCILISRAMGDRQGYNPFFAPYPTLLNAFPLRYVFIERNGPGGQWTLNVPQQYAVNPTAVFNVSGYYYPNDLQGGDDTTFFTTQPELCDAMLNLTVAMSFYAEDAESKQGQAREAIYERLFREASYSDTQQRLAGRSLTM